MKKIPSISIDSLKRLVSSRPFRSHLPKTKEDALIIDKLPGLFLLLALLVAIYYLFGILKPFLSVLVIAAVLSVAFYPMYTGLKKLFRGSGNLASLVSCLLVVVIIIVPLALFILMLTNEAFSTYQAIRFKVESGVFDQYLLWQDGGFFYDLKQRIDPFVDINALDLKKNIVEGAQNLSTFLFDQTANLLAGISSLLFSFGIMLFSMFYFFRDGTELIKRVGMMSPLPAAYEQELFRKIDSMVKAIVFGVFLTSIIQGVIGGIGFAIAGISNPIFWGTAIAFFSVVPMVGTAAIWFPAAVILAILGNYGAAIFIFLWGLFAVGTVDNFVRPYLIGGRANTYPLITFFVILGGIFTMGLKGIIVGPLILMVVLSLLHIYEAEYRKVLKK